jgi:hypothetical protein
MRDVFRTVAALRSVLSAHRDLLLEILALRHQLGVLARSDRRFRPSDRLLWVCLRRWWPRWREILVLVQPATVARWHREGFRGCWSRRSRRRPGRPRIDSQLRALISANGHRGVFGRSADPRRVVESRVTLSERTVSRYLPDRLTEPSQTWRTFLANHLGNLAFASTVTALFGESDDDGVDVCGLCPHAMGGTLPVSGHSSIGLLRSHRRLMPGVLPRISFAAARAHVSARARTRRSRGPSTPVLAASGWRFVTSHEFISTKEFISV